MKARDFEELSVLLFFAVASIVRVIAAILVGVAGIAITSTITVVIAAIVNTCFC